MKQGLNEPVDSYYSRFKRIIKRIDTGTASFQDAQKLYYFKKRLRAEILPILLTYILADLATLLGLARTYKQGTNFTTNADSSLSTSKATTYDKKIKQLTKQINQILLNYTTIISALSTQTEKQYWPRQSTQGY